MLIIRCACQILLEQNLILTEELMDSSIAHHVMETGGGQPYNDTEKAYVVSHEGLALIAGCSCW